MISSKIRKCCCVVTGHSSSGCLKPHQRFSSLENPESSPAFNDLYAQVLCLWEALAGYPFPGQVPEPLGTDWQPGEPEIGLPEVPWFKMAAILCGKGPDPASHDYSEWFGV
jgi:hypothetical protein